MQKSNIVADSYRIPAHMSSLATSSYQKSSHSQERPIRPQRVLTVHLLLFCSILILSRVGGSSSLGSVDKSRGRENLTASLPLREAWLNRDSDGLMISRELELHLLLLRILGVLV